MYRLRLVNEDDDWWGSIELPDGTELYTTRAYRTRKAARAAARHWWKHEAAKTTRYEHGFEIVEALT